VCLCYAPGGMVVRGSGCDHRLSPKLRQPRHSLSVGLSVVASNTYPQNHLLTTTLKILQDSFCFVFSTNHSIVILLVKGNLTIGKILLTSPIVINVPNRAPLAVETKDLFFLAYLNNSL